jgi:uncharacterized membrane protein YfcA
MSLLALGLALAVGALLGLLGGGGSILTVPILVYVVGLTPKVAIATSLAVVGGASVLGMLGYWRVGAVNVRIAAPFALVAMAGTLLGTRLSAYLSGATQLVIFALVMLLAAGAMLRGRRAELGRAPGSTLPPLTGGRLARVAAAGAVVGGLTGLVGVGGGFLIVPALVLLLDLPMREAVGTSLLVIALNAATGLVGYAGQIAIPWGLAAAFAGAAMIGIFAGTALARVVPPMALRRGFALFLVGMGVLILFQNRAVLLPG